MLRAKEKTIIVTNTSCNNAMIVPSEYLQSRKRIKMYRKIARSIVPFPLEIDQHFIAAVLTVIGFSMNDTVIVFDRIREDRRLYPSAPLGDTINRAINETLSRTIMTSLTVFLTILILFIVGGEVTRGFAFAMLIGVVTGTYSSIFVAAPILVDLGVKKDVKTTTVSNKEEKAVPAKA